MINGRNLLIYLSLKHNGQWKEIYEDVKHPRVVDDEEVTKAIESLDCEVVTILDHEYPQSLKNAPHTPFVLYYKGNIELIKDESKCVAIVGTRSPSNDSLFAINEIVKAYNGHDYAVVSSGAKGTNIHALSKATNPVCILGNGFHYNYPMECKGDFDKIAKRGLLISEYPPNAEPRATNFATNKRLVAGLSKAILCGEAESRSGTMLAISFALAQGKDCGVIPQPYGSDLANNSLIANGALMIGCVEDALTLVGE